MKKRIDIFDSLRRSLLRNSPCSGPSRAFAESGTPSARRTYGGHSVSHLSLGAYYLDTYNNSVLTVMRVLVIADCLGRPTTGDDSAVGYSAAECCALRARVNAARRRWENQQYKVTRLRSWHSSLRVRKGVRRLAVTGIANSTWNFKLPGTNAQ